MTVPVRDLADLGVFVDAIDHPESVAFGKDGAIYCGGEAGQVYRMDEEGQAELLASTGGLTLGICLDGHGNIYTCDPALGAVMRVSPAGQVDEYSRGTEQRPMMLPNFGVFDESGRLFVSDSGGFDQRDGAIYVIEPGGPTRVLTREAANFPNGLALSADGRTLYVVFSSPPALGRIPVGDTVGSLEIITELPGTVPDGLALDRSGHLWVACYAPDQILRVSPGGGLELLVADERRVKLASPTGIAFSPSDPPRLLIANFAVRHLSVLEGVPPGQPLNYPLLPA